MTARDRADAALVARMAAGERAALSELAVREGAPLLAYLRLLVAERALAEELLQDTLQAAWRGADGFAGRASVRSWLFALARRRAADALGRPRLRLVPEDATGLGDLSSPEPSAEDLAIAAAAPREVAEAVARLGPLQREALALTFAHGFSDAELAEVLGIPLDTVKSRLGQAKRALRVLLAEGADADAAERTDR